ncbi:MAG TPA: HAMP domain-containing histidine kinase, partial [Gammaproteobacteria bacterium]|nr:HAMP domain-containing histidine kinase [Gammaproteobacteria bacterium]
MTFLDFLFGPNPDDRIRAVQLRTLYKNALAIYLVGYVNTPLIVLVMWQSGVSHAALLAWWAAMYALLTVRVIICRHYWKDPEPEKRIDVWQRRFTIPSLISGILWGTAGVLFYIPDGGIYQAFLVIVLVSIGSGSMTFLAMHLPTYYGFFTLLMLPLLVRIAMVGGLVHLIMAGMLVLYYVVFVYLGRTVNQVFLESAVLRFDNLEAIARLTAEKEAAEKANISKSKFLAAASHDLRQPLHALSLLSGALAERIQYKEVKDIVSKMRLAVSALENLFNSLLDISKLDSGVLQPQVEEVPLAVLFQRIENDHRPEAEDKGLAFVVEDCGGVMVRSDSILLERVLRNFVTNAIRYTEQGRVTLSCQVQDGEVIVRVADTGIGIPPEVQENIFDEYFQVDNPGRQQSKGLGLGLAIVARISRLLGHQIEVESNTNEGSV